MQRKEISCFYYIAHKNNIKSILKNGVFSHKKKEKEELEVTKIYDKEVISIRKNKKLPNGDCLSDYSNFYFNPRNPMMYRVLSDMGNGNFSKGVKDVLLLEINQNILDDKDVYIATGNAASNYTEFLCVEKGIKKLNTKVLYNDYWTNIQLGKNKVMAEVLVKEKIEPDKIISVYTGDQKTLKELKETVSHDHPKINFILDKTKFFLPNKSTKLNEKIVLNEGDMFFSRAKILTISVNTVGVMGKGLASRAKYQFPDVYVEYQNLCRNKRLVMGKPCLIKREESVSNILSYDPNSLEENRNDDKWFLLFPTKTHWRYNSDLQGIEEGLKYLVKLSKKENLESIALPALGCGLGNLSWQEVGPLMCKYINQMENIQYASIYLPMKNNNIEGVYKTKEFLLKLK